MRIKRRMALAATTFGILAAALAATVPPEPAAAAPPGGPYHFQPSGPVRIFDTRSSGKLVPGATMAVPVNTYLNLTAVEVEAPRSLLTLTPCGGGPSRTLALSSLSPSLFFTGAADCMTTDTGLHLIADRVATEGPVDADGVRYVRVPAEPAVLAVDGGPSLHDSSYALDLGAAVPADADGIAAEIFGVSGSVVTRMTIAPCATEPLGTHLSTGTSDFGDVNVAHVIRPPGAQLCLHVGPVPEGFSAHVALLGYFTDSLASGGDVPPSYETRVEVRPGLAPREPARVLDTRTGVGAPVGKVAAGGTLTLDLSGVVSPATAAVTLNVTATEPDAAGYVTAYPCADGLPDSSNLNYRAGADVPNLVIVEPDADGLVCLFSSASTHLLADLGGTYERGAGLGYQDEGPRRVLDTRSGTGAPPGRVAADSVTRLPIRSAGGEIPAAVTINLTAVAAGGYGYVTAFPCDQPRPGVSNLNYTAGQTVATISTVKLSAAGELCLYSFGATHLLADLAGTYSDAAPGRLALAFPSRWFDSRDEGAVTDAGSVWQFTAPDFASSMTSVIANLTATAAGEPGYLAGFDCAPNVPDTSNLNYAPGTDVANLAFVPLDGDLSFCLYNSGATHELVDVFAWITPDLAWPTLTVGVDL